MRRFADPKAGCKSNLMWGQCDDKQGSQDADSDFNQGKNVIAIAAEPFDQSGCKKSQERACRDRYESSQDDETPGPQLIAHRRSCEHLTHCGPRESCVSGPATRPNYELHEDYGGREHGAEPPRRALRWKDTISWARCDRAQKGLMGSMHLKGARRSIRNFTVRIVRGNLQSIQRLRRDDGHDPQLLAGLATFDLVWTLEPFHAGRDVVHGSHRVYVSTPAKARPQLRNSCAWRPGGCFDILFAFLHNTNVQLINGAPMQMFGAVKDYSPASLG
jgi:hypothetical protein